MINFKRLERYLRVALSSWRAEDTYEDAVQEGLIRAWKDTEAGMADEDHVKSRAKLWAKNYLKDARTGRRTPTGAPSRTRDGRQDSRGIASREKITQFVDEYVRIHDKPPTNIEVSRATGLSTSVVGYQRRVIREGRMQNNAIYTEEYGERRIDHAAYTVGHFTDETSDALEGAFYSIAANRVNFEEDLISEMDFYALLGKLDERHKKILFWYHILGYEAKEVATALGYAPVSSTGSRHIKDAHTAAKSVLETGELPKVVKRTYPNRRKPRVLKPRPQKTHCTKNHELRGYRPSSGKRYCKICNNLRTHPGKTEADIPETSKLWAWDKRPEE